MRNAREGGPRTGVLLLDKPAGMTSHDVVQRVRRIFGQREVGHTGTLDPMATGLLVLVLGGATRTARFIEAADKRYIGTVRFGRATTTCDAEGETTCEADAGHLTDEAVRAALPRLVGVLEQRVPAFSAVKVDGERLYKKARRGEEVEAPTRSVTIHALEAVRIALPEVEVEALVSKGTYVRSLAVQLGELLGLPAHLAALRRTAVGRHRIADARRLESLAGTQDELGSLESAVAHLAEVVLDPRQAERVNHGGILSAAELRGSARGSFAAGDALRLTDGAGRLRALAFARVAHVASPQEVPPAPPADVRPDERGLDYACVFAGTV